MTDSRLGLSRGLLVCSMMTLVGVAACGESEERPTGGAPPPSQTLTAPIFKGVSAGRLTDDGVLLEWHDAVDAESDTQELVYIAYKGVGDDPVDTSRPVGVSVPGATSLLVQDLEPERYRFIVRARDPDGLEEKNRASVRVSFLDEVAPEFAGVVGTIPQGPNELFVEWNAAMDDETPQHQLRYLVYAAGASEDVFDQEPVESEPGATSMVIPLAEEWPSYWVGVRAIDAAGNVDQNTRMAASDAPENEAPAFAGIASSESLTEGVILRWSPAVDNVTSSQNIRYQVFYSRMSGEQDLGRPDIVTEAGVTQVQINELIAGADYFFIVRAVDEAGNVDENSFETQVATLPKDNVLPTFFGLREVESNTPSSVRVSWHVATDARTGSADMVYEVYASESSPVLTANGPAVVPPPGRQEVEILGLEPNTTYYITVRALDEAGNASLFGTEMEVTTLEESTDSVPPTLEGGVTAEVVPSDSGLLFVTWEGMLDNRAEEEEIRGHVCVGREESDCAGSRFFDNFNSTGEFGARSVFVSGLDPRTDYFVGVRLEDVNGNIESVTTGAIGFTATSFTTNVEPILQVRCNQCHEYSYGTLVNIVAMTEDGEEPPNAIPFEDPDFGQLYLIDAASPLRSYLLRKLRDLDSSEPPFSGEFPARYDGVRMPSDGSEYLSPEVEQIFLDWIEQGAFWN